MTTTWQNVQIGGGGWVTGLTASTTGSAIYARTDVGGAYAWDGAKNSWRPITKSLPNDSANSGPLEGIGSIAVDPVNAHRVFIAAGTYTYNNPSGIYVPGNARAATPTWTAVDATIRVNGKSKGRPFGERLVVDPNNPNIVYYGTNNVSRGGTGLRRYVYNGSTWAASTVSTPAVGDAGTGITFVAADKRGGTVAIGWAVVSKYLYFGVYSNTTGSGGVYASVDGGQSWSKVTGPAVARPARSEVDGGGTLFVTYNGLATGSGGVARIARGSGTSL